MLEKLGSRGALVRINHQTAFHKIHKFGGPSALVLERRSSRLSLHHLQHHQTKQTKRSKQTHPFQLRPFQAPHWRISLGSFDRHDSQGPNVDRFVVAVARNDFRGHPVAKARQINKKSNQQLLRRSHNALYTSVVLRQFRAKTKISQFHVAQLVIQNIVRPLKTKKNRVNFIRHQQGDFSLQIAMDSVHRMNVHQYFHHRIAQIRNVSFCRRKKKT